MLGSKTERLAGRILTRKVGVLIGTLMKSSSTAQTIRLFFHRSEITTTSLQIGSLVKKTMASTHHIEPGDDVLLLLVSEVVHAMFIGRDC